MIPYFSIGDIVLYGKWKNKRGRLVAFGMDKWGNPTIEIEPIPKGRKHNKIIGLYRIWKADIKKADIRNQSTKVALRYLTSKVK
jgi:hypothetical protein